MTHEAEKDREGLRHGLPRMLAEDPNRLSDLLELTRKDRLRIVTLVPKDVRARIDTGLKKRPEPVKPGESDRVLVQVHYGDPEVRQAAWEVWLERGPGGKPSPEAAVLADFVDAEREAAEPSDESADDRTESERIADRAWADTRERLARWDELEEPERQQCVLRTFAVATLRDDPAVLKEAIEIAPDLRDQFESLLPEEQLEEEADSITDPAETASAKWTALTGSLKDLVARAEGPPANPDPLEGITSLIESLNALEPSVRAELSSAAFAEFLVNVRGTLEEIESEPAFWLNDERRTSLEEAWEACRGSLTGDALDLERRRFQAGVGEAADLVRVTAGELADAKERIQAHRAKEPDDPFAQDDWSGALAELQEKEHACRKRHRDAQTSLLNELSPRGEGLGAPETSPEPPTPEPEPEPEPEPAPDESDSDLPTRRAPEPDPEPPGPAQQTGSLPEPEPPKPSPTPPPKPEPEKPDPEPPKPSALGDSSKRRPPAPLVPAKQQPSEPSQPASPRPPARRDPLAVKAEEAIIAALVEEPPRLGYAFQTARLLERTFPGGSPQRSRLLEAVLLAGRLRAPDGGIALRLRDVLTDFPTLESGWSEEETAFQATVRFAACLRPALLAPITPAFSVFSNLPRSDRYPALHDLSHRLAGHAARLQGARVDSSFLRAIRSDAELEATRKKCVQEISEWRRDAPRKTMPYQPATAVWQRWVQPSGEIGRVMANLDAEILAGVPIQQVVSRWRDRAWVTKLVADTDRKMRGSLHPGAGIRFKALDRIVTETRKAGELAQRYLDLATAPSGASDHRVRVLSALRLDLERSAPEVFEQLVPPAASREPWVRVGTRLAAHAIEGLREALDPQHDADERDTEPDPGDLLVSGFFTTEVVLGRDDQPVGEPREVLSSVIEEPPRSIERAVRAHLGSGHLFTAQRMLDWAEHEDGEDVQNLRADLEAARAREKDELEGELRIQRDKMESGLMLGVVSADDREYLDPLLVESERQLADPEFLRFHEVRKRLADTRDDLDRMTEQHLQTVRGDYQNLNLPAESDHALAICRAIESRDIVTANELIQQIRDNPDFVIPESTDRDILSEFFPERAKEISEELEEAGGANAVLDRVRRGKGFGNVSGARRDSAARMLEAWIALKKQGHLGSDSGRVIARLFSEIGFVVRGVEATTRIPNTSVVETVRLEGRDQSPVPMYGSGAHGRYRVICCWNRPAVEDLMQYTHQRGGGPPPIVLYFGRLTERQRKQLAGVCRERQETLVVLDETVLVFLCGERGSRLSALFHCTLPFTHVMPYHTQGGIAPPEMFFGRVHETEAVRSPRGPCFLYGGRQLGKTAILKAVEQREHRPTEDRYAFFVDLKNHDIGVLRDVADIWPLLWRMLGDGGAIPVDVKEPSAKNGGRIERFLDALVRHFAPDQGRTLLLLLDEADRFLEVDSREQQKGVAASGYRESIRLKRLMDDTERSIKVVFAGLHNVLRTVEQANHPLGQFGKPIHVGPLLHNGEMRAARDLLLRPLLAAGYRLPGDLVTRILGQTNYYPSFIQPYGAELIDAMLSQSAGAPPFTVTPEVVEAAYRGKGLREFTRERFQWTLDLDKRYEVIAYSIAWLCLSEENALVTGFPRRRIYEEAATWWPAGFAESSGEEFASLLDETVGLGVLRTTGTEEARAYTLRNPNVLLLMGTKDEIEEKLLEDREPPQEFKPRILRARRKPDVPDHPSRSPLTFQQQGRLFAEEDGVVLLSGTAAAGLNDVLDAFGSLPDRPLVRLEGVPDREFFGTALRGSVKRQEHGLRVHAVLTEAPWAAGWIRDAQSYLRSLRKSNRHVRVLFIANGDRLPALMRDPGVWNIPRLERIFLEPWRDGFVRQWMQDVAIGDSAELRGKIIEMTGGWSALLMRLHELTGYLGNAELALEELDTELSDSDQQHEWRRQLCLDDPETCTVLRPLADFGELSKQEILEAAEEGGMSRPDAELRLRWAAHLGLARLRLKWSVNPLVGRLVRDLDIG